MCHMHLLSFWTQESIRNLNSGTARPGLFSLLLRRFPAVFGRNPVDFQAWLLEPKPDGLNRTGSSVDIRLAEVRQMTDEELEARLQELQRRAG